MCAVQVGVWKSGNFAAHKSPRRPYQIFPVSITPRRRWGGVGGGGCNLGRARPRFPNISAAQTLGSGGIKKLLAQQTPSQKYASLNIINSVYQKEHLERPKGFRCAPASSLLFLGLLHSNTECSFKRPLFAAHESRARPTMAANSCIWVMVIAFVNAIFQPASSCHTLFVRHCM